MTIGTDTRLDPESGDFQSYRVDEEDGIKTQGVYLAEASDIHYRSTAAEDDAVVHANPASMHWLEVELDASITDDRWLMVFDSTTVPADTTKPKFAWMIPTTAAGKRSSRFVESVTGFRFDTGVSIAISSTKLTLTKTSATEGAFQAQGKSRATS